MEKNIFTISRINGPVVHVKTDGSPGIGEQVLLGDLQLIGEVISVTSNIAIVQVYEETIGLIPGMEAKFLGIPLSVELGPGLIGSIYDGIQRPLTEFAKSSNFILRGIKTNALDQQKKWHFVPKVNKGDLVSSLMIIGEVKESYLVNHKIMVPYKKHGRIVEIKPEGLYSVSDCIAVVELSDSKIRENIKLAHFWPIRKPRPYVKRLLSKQPLFTGQRVIDFFFPIAKGGAASIPGGFGTGKTNLQHQLAKWSNADIIVYIGCGERGNEMTQVLTDFPKLIDPNSGKSLMERTILIANTSNMPVTAREASIYTGITIAEYYRDMGYNVAVMADSTSRWAEALREISGRLEEMPAEEGYPAYLASRLAEFYERAGYVIINEEDKREGTITVIGAVSPQGGDFSEPVTQHTARFIKSFWALDKELAGARHFPSVNWSLSYSEYIDNIKGWWKEKYHISWEELRVFAIELLQKDYKLTQVVKLIGEDALPDKQRLILETGKMIKEAFLQQDAFNAIDTYCSASKQLFMMYAIKIFNEKAFEILTHAIPIMKIMELPVIERIMRMKYTTPNDKLEEIQEIIQAVDKELDELI